MGPGCRGPHGRRDRTDRRLRSTARGRPSAPFELRRAFREERRDALLEVFRIAEDPLVIALEIELLGERVPLRRVEGALDVAETLPWSGCEAPRGPARAVGCAAAREITIDTGATEADTLTLHRLLGDEGEPVRP